MTGTRWTKVARDLWTGRGRTALMVVAIAAGNAGVGAILVAHEAITRAMATGYLGTSPASATIELDAADGALAAEVRGLPGVAAAEARASVLGRVRVGPDTWRPLLLFVVEDFEAMQVSTVRRESGWWPPPAGSMLVERSALGMLGAGPGDDVVVKTPNGPPGHLEVAGVVHDPSLAPAWQERAVYGYVTPETLRLLGERATLDEMKILVADPNADMASVEQTARGVAAWLAARGHTVERIEVPPPRTHPHQAQMTSVMIILLVFAALRPRAWRGGDDTRAPARHRRT